MEEHLTVTLILLLIIIASGVTLYYYVSNMTVSSQQASSKGRPLARVESAKCGPGYLQLVVRCLKATCSFDKVYVYSSSGDLLSVIELPEVIKVREGEARPLSIPYILLNTNISGYVHIVLGGSAAVTYSSDARTVFLSATMRRLKIGIFVDRASSPALNVTPGLTADSAFILNPLTGYYSYVYSSGTFLLNGVKGEGRTSVLTLSSYQRLPLLLRNYVVMNSTTVFIDFHSLYYNSGLSETQVERLLYTVFGPFIVIVNPTNGVKPYRVVIHGYYGDIRNYYLPPVASSEYDVGVDLLILFEDLWSPLSVGLLDNYVDEVFRVTVFTNNTIVLWEYHGSGAYLHSVFINPLSLSDMANVMSVYENCPITTTQLRQDPSLGTIASVSGSIAEEKYASSVGLVFIKPHEWDSTSDGIYVPYGSGEIVSSLPKIIYRG